MYICLSGGTADLLITAIEHYAVWSLNRPERSENKDLMKHLAYCMDLAFNGAKLLQLIYVEWHPLIH